ncbi:hypothetical protein FHS70_004582 [Flammeovirga yaeyamensis]|nr:hypothetical protein [Flammeovirga yaeyamensis]
MSKIYYQNYLNYRYITISNVNLMLRKLIFEHKKSRETDFSTLNNLKRSNF